MMCEHKPGEEVEYTPRSGGIIVYRVGTERDRRRMNLAINKALKSVPKEDIPSQNLAAAEIAVEMFVLSVDGVDGRAGPITNGSDVVEHGSTELLDELAELVIGAMTVGAEQQGKSEGSPISQPKATQASSETAENAQLPGSTSTATAMEGATLIMSTPHEEV